MLKRLVGARELYRKRPGQPTKRRTNAPRPWATSTYDHDPPDTTVPRGGPPLRDPGVFWQLSGDLFSVYDGNGVFVDVNPAWERVMGWRRDQLIGRPVSQFIHPDDAGAAGEAAYTAAAGSRRVAEVESRWLHADGSYRWLSWSAYTDGVAWSGVAKDISDRKHAEALRDEFQRRDRLRGRLLDEVDAAVIGTDLDGGVTFWSQGAEKLYGWTEAEAMGADSVALTVPEHFREGGRSFIASLRSKKRWEGDLELQHKDGRLFTGHLRSSVVCDEEGNAIGFVGVSVDATERIAAEESVRERRDFLRAVMDSIGEGLITTDASGAVTFMNRTAEERLGWTTGELLGKNLDATVHRRPDGTQAEEERDIVSAARQGAVRADDEVLYRRDGSAMPISYTAAPHALPGGETGTVLVFADLTERKSAQQALNVSAAQLKAIVENTTASIYIKRRGDYRYLMANPVVERMFGREAGEIVGLRDEDLLPAGAVAHLREADRRVIEEGVEISLEEEVMIAGEPRTFRTMKFPLPDEHGDPYALCAISTDITEIMQREAELRERLEWQQRITTAIREDRLLVYAQPIIDLTTGAVVSHELLVRMQGYRGADDIVSPADFLPAAERFGLMSEIDAHMCRRGIEIAAEGHAVEINLSGQSMSDDALLDEISRQLRTTGADPTSIVFEVTETSAVADIDIARRFSERIVAMGCKCALDDFGTGFGSLTYQRHLAVQYLKIDISFVCNIVNSPDDQRLVKSIVSLAREYGQHTVAEGVEDGETLDMLRELGVDFAQGYYIGRPESAAFAPLPRG